METGTGTEADAEPRPGAQLDTSARRSDRWSSAPDTGSGTLWVVTGAVLVLGGYALALLVVSAARDALDLSDEVGKVLLAATPALAGLGAVLAFVGTRRGSFRLVGWLVVVLGAALVLVSIAAVAWLLLVLRSFD
ncbi:MAG: hypothetical protein ACXVQU_05700 [Actinomycetota bacterium]